MSFQKDVRVVGGASKLLAFYRKTFRPTDIFTYQDTTGEVTDVYEHCGFTLIKQNSKKQYLVSPGKTIETGNRKEVLGMAYATRYGPDRILGTKLGEVFREDGSRKSNKEIFIEDLGWHIEETTGDRVYEWFKPDLTFYTYKITATDSDKYYFGVSHVKTANATEQDCLTDGYYGSGGLSATNKYANWKLKHRTTLEKEIVSIHSSKAEAYLEEKKLIGERWADDPLCLNSIPGGILGPIGKNIELRTCPSHGSSIFIGLTCVKCKNQANVSINVCPTHGAQKFIGTKCYLCRKGVNRHVECVVHGLSVALGYSCLKCALKDRDILGKCAVHGEALHRGGKCITCVNNKAVTTQSCSIHGEQKFIGNQCYKCIPSADAEKECAVHGVTTFRGANCMKCSMNNATSMRECSEHGLSKHRGASCQKCTAKKASAMKLCKRHGLSKFQGNSCRKCSAEKTAHTRKHLTKDVECRFCIE